MTKWTIEQQGRAAVTYLSKIHGIGPKENILALHTFMYYLNWETCPICQIKLITEVR